MDLALSPTSILSICIATLKLPSTTDLEISPRMNGKELSLEILIPNVMDGSPLEAPKSRIPNTKVAF